MDIKEILWSVKQKSKIFKNLAIGGIEKYSKLAIKFVVVLLIIAMSPINILYAEDVVETSTSGELEKFENTLHLDVQNPMPVQFNKLQAPEIVHGESEIQRKEREESERKSAQEASRAVISRESSSTRSVSYSSDPGLAEKRALAKRAAAAYGIDWKILEAVWQVESGKSWNISVKSYAGAQGPMQFMPGTWRAYGQDGNGDGVKDVNNAEDALYGAANYLAASGAASGNIDRALFAYNRAQWYVDKVKRIANSIVD